MFSLTIKDPNGQIADRFTFREGSFLIGRAEACDIVLRPSKSVSRKHARLFVENDRCFIEDLGSSNGVIVDGHRVLTQRDLGNASQIQIGDFYLFVERQQSQMPAEQRVLQTLFIPNDDKEHYKLVRINDHFAGEEFVLSETHNTIGRTDENFILLSDTSISRKHAVIRRQGDRYRVEDLESSNGTRVNGKEVRKPTVLKRGDRVEFGNVEFVFVDGTTQVDPRSYAGSSGPSRTVIVASLIAFLLIGVSIGGVIVLNLLDLRDDDTSEVAASDAKESKTDSIDAKVEELLTKAERQMKLREWDAAIATLDEARNLAPDDGRVREQRERALLERRAAQKLEQGEKLSEQGRPEQAREILRSIPEGTDAHRRARGTLEYLDKTIAHELRTEARRLVKDGGREELTRAHEMLVRAVELDASDENLEQLRSLEKKMRRKGLDFEPYDASASSPKKPESGD
jgi:pSer/pThr/pTyr-binding forkhead associated (FHA) protein